MIMMYIFYEGDGWEVFKAFSDIFFLSQSNQIQLKSRLSLCESLLF